MYVIFLIFTISGLQIKVKGISSHYTFSYAWSPVAEHPPKIDWTDIREKESASPHIRCYWLSDGKEEEFSAFMANTVNFASTVALILVNTKNDFEVDDKFLPPNQRYGLPIAIVVQSIGKRLRGIFMKHNRELQATMEMNPNPPKGISSIIHRGQRLLSWLSEREVELVTAVQGLLFPPEEEGRIASEDTYLFALVMAEFDRVETKVCHID